MSHPVTSSSGIIISTIQYNLFENQFVFTFLFTNSNRLT